MVMTTYPTEQGDGQVRVRILASTICKPHGEVAAGDIVEVHYNEYLQLKWAGKAELYVEPGPDPAVTMSEEEFKAALDGKTKAELVALAKQHLGVDLSESSKKDELIAAIVEAARK